MKSFDVYQYGVADHLAMYLTKFGPFPSVYNCFNKMCFPLKILDIK